MAIISRIRAALARRRAAAHAKKVNRLTEKYMRDNPDSRKRG
jgi:hypothetical protein